MPLDWLPASQINRETVGSLVTIVAGVGVYHHNSIEITAVGLAAICLNMLFAVLERLMQRHLMAQARLGPADAATLL